MDRDISIVKDYNHGNTIIELTQKYNISKSRISVILKNKGVQCRNIRPRINILSSEKELVENLYTSGFTIKEIWDETRLTRYKIRKILKGKTRNQYDSISLKYQRNAPKITNFQKQAILGTLLGDASLIKIKHRRSYFYKHTQGKIHSLYSEHIRDLLNANFSIEQSKSCFNPQSEFYVNRLWNARELPQIAKLCKINGKKQVNLNWINQLNEIALAYWFMDDGSNPKLKNGRQRITLHTEGFSLNENKLLQSVLCKFGCCPRVKNRVKNKKKYYYLMFSSTEGKKFINLIKPYIDGTGMEYKIN
jgi:hypothetical protein